MKNYYTILGLFYILSGVLFYYFKRIITTQNNFLNYWIAGFFISGVGILSYIQFDNNTENIELFMFSLLFNIPILIGNLLIYRGYTAYEQKKSKLTLSIALPILSLLASLIFTLIYSDSQISMATNGIIVSCMYVYIGYKIRNKNVSKFYKNRFIYYIAAFIHFGRFLHALFINKDHFMPETMLSKTVLVVGCLITMVLVFNIIIVLMTDLNNALKNQLKTKDQLYRVISHDVKGQLNNLLNYHIILKNSYKDWNEKKINDWVLEIENIAVSSYTLMENMLLWSSESQQKIELHLSSHNLVELVKNGINFFNSQLNFKQQQIEFTYKNDVYVECDKNIVDTIIRNLIDNAIKNSGVNEKISIEIQDKGNRVCCIVKNKIKNNATMCLSNIDVILNQKTNIETGHGLSICRDFVQTHAGELTYTIEEGNTVKIMFYIPRKKQTIK
jgi:two-component system, sensor histidine kinase and response regulator